MSEKYVKVSKGPEQLPNNEIRVKRTARVGRYLRRAYDLLRENKDEKIVIKGVSNAMENVVKLAELIKHRIKGLHSITEIQNINIVDEYEPLEEGLDKLKFTRIATMLTITLTRGPVDTKHIGY